MHSRDGAVVRLFLIHLEDKNGAPLHIYNLTEPGRLSVHVTFLPVVHLKGRPGSCRSPRARAHLLTGEDHKCHGHHERITELSAITHRSRAINSNYH